MAWHWVKVAGKKKLNLSPANMNAYQAATAFMEQLKPSAITFEQTVKSGEFKHGELKISFDIFDQEQKDSVMALNVYLKHAKVF